MFLLSIGPLQAQPATRETPTQPQPGRETMTFRLVEAPAEPGLATPPRWIAASGRITRRTVPDFKQFLAVNRVSGLTVYLDSHGGLVGASLALGREFRAAGLNTGVGRTITLPSAQGAPRHALVTHGASCHSACVYALMGGVERVVAPSVRLGVHQFSGRVDSEDAPPQTTFGIEDFRSAQRQTAAIAAYMYEMGIDVRLLPIITRAPYGEPLQALRRPDIAGMRLAAVTADSPAVPGSFPWAMFERSDNPSLHRRQVRMVDRRPVEDDIAITCTLPGRAALQWRIGWRDRGQSSKPQDSNTPEWNGSQISAGGERQRLRVARGASGTQAGPAPSVWITAPLEPATLRAMAATGQFDLILDGAEGEPERRIALGDPGFGTMMRRFRTACDAVTSQSSAGQPTEPERP